MPEPCLALISYNKEFLMGFSQNDKGANLWRGPTIFRILNFCLFNRLFTPPLPRDGGTA